MPDHRMPEQRVPEHRMPENRVPENRASQRRVPKQRAPEQRAAENTSGPASGRAAERGTSDRDAPRAGASGNGAPAQRRVTAADVARLAGVSRATVSHVLNDQVERFNAGTVERVHSAVAELGYVPSGAGRALVRGRSDFIVVVVPNTTFIRLQDCVDILSADIAGLGFTMAAHFVSGSPGASSARLRHLVEALRPAGLVDLGGLTGPDLAMLRRAGCPVLSQQGSGDVNARIGLLQARHLRERGYSELSYAFLSDARADPYGRSRAAAVTGFCVSAGLPAPPRLHVPADPGAAREALAGLVASRGSPVAIACHNDTVALALVFAAHRLGLAVPGEVAVIGAENIDVGQAVQPRLTTVAGDVPAVLRPFRQALAEAYGGPAAPDATDSLAEAFQVLPGETT